MSLFPILGRGELSGLSILLIDELTEYRRVLSDSGRCYPFDHKASGFGRGEAVGCVILKPYQDALDDRDVIRALTIDTSINQDGRTRGIATPNPVSQAALMRTAYRNAGVDPMNTGYVEAHGTGTKVGDPLEASAIHSVFSEGRTPKNPLLMGSLKSNIGHTEGASGIVSVIKTALMLQHGFVLPTCGFEKPNEKIPLNEWKIKVRTLPSNNPGLVLTGMTGTYKTATVAPRERLCQCKQLRCRRFQRPCYPQEAPS